jgi:hypothetical protein
MKTEVMTVTPAMAEKWLAATTFRNRNVSATAVNRYANDMTRGRWALNGESIVIDDNGNVIDGQHRLRAVIKSGVSIQSVVVRGADQSVFPTFDIGAKRGGKDVLSIAGYANANSLAAILRNIDMFTRRGFENTRGGGGSYVRSRLDFLQLASDHPSAVESASFVKTHEVRCEVFRPVSFAGCMHYLMGQQNQAARDAFFESIASRVPHFSGSCPTISLWKKYSTIKIQKEMTLSLKYRYEVWNASWDPFQKRFDLERNERSKKAIPSVARQFLADAR